ncbi:MAG: PorV/PorQ family protein [candidate division WOR-3 bacterium]
MTLTVSLLSLILIATGPGTTVMPLLRVGQGVRASGLGEAYIGLADDASALYWNPGGLGQIQNWQIAFSHHQWFTDIKDELLHAALPLKTGTIGLGLLYSGNPGIESWNDQNEPGDTFATWDGSFSLGYGGSFLEDYHFGLALKGLFENLHEATGYGAGADLGFLARPMPFLGIGLTLRNIGRMFYSSEVFSLPTEIGLGAGFQSPILKATLDAVYPFDYALNLRGGVEFSPVKDLALRLGYRTGPADLSTLGFLSGLTLGLGVTLKNFSFDYCLTPYGKLGIGHRIGLVSTIPRSGLGGVLITTLDAETMKPLWATVTLSGVRELVAETDRRGQLRVTGLRPGQLVIRTQCAGYLSRTDTMLILGDREQTAIIALQPLKFGSIWGRIYDAATRQTIGGTITYQGPVYGEESVAPSPGSFTLRSLPSGDYILTANGPSPEFISQTCTLKVEPGRVTSHDFYLVKRKQTIVLEGINFETGKADILPQFEPVLDRAGKILLANPSIQVELAGHTDPREINTAQFPSNWELSQARAEAVRRYLIEKFHIAPERLVARGYADTQPIASNETEEGMAKNRRTEFRIIEE